MVAGSGLFPPPTTEIGTEQPLGAGSAGLGSSVAPWWTFVDFYEETSELQWPNSVRTFTRMRADSQVEGLYFGSTLPIRRYKWSIDPNGADSRVVEEFAKDVNLPLKGEDAKPRPRMKGRFSFDQFLFHALLSPLYGHMYFEQVGAIGDDGLWRLRKLSPRMPDTIQEIKVAPDGGLVSIAQYAGIAGQDIPVDRLVAFIWAKEGANWAGRSMLRSIYRDYVVKDRLIRLTAMQAERNSLGVPTVEAPPNASAKAIQQMNALAQSFRAGEYAGGALPNGAKLRLVGVEGTLPDIEKKVQQRDEAMARRFLMMFMQLGQTQTGSRALGGAFIDWFALAQEAIADFIVDVFTEHVIEDWVDWNFGEDTELTPRLHYERDEDTQLASTDLVSMIDSGLITVDDELEEAIRGRYDLPPAELDKAQRTQIRKVDQEGHEINATPPPPPPAIEPPSSSESEPPGAPEPPGDSPPSSARRPAERRSPQRAAAAAPPLSLPARKLRRQPYDHEVRAQVDYATMDVQWAHGVDNAVLAWGPVRATQVDALHQAVIDAGGSLPKLAKMEAPAVGADVIHQHLAAMADQGANGAMTEATRQGISIAMPGMSAVHKALEARAEATDQVLASALSQAASQRAIRLTGGSLSASDVANNVRDYLNGMSDSWLKDQLGGAIQAAMNAGRKEVIGSGPPSQLYASELLDTSTCGPCTDIDGTNYETMDDADADYPTGGYSDCEGGPRCRGTVVAVYDSQDQGGDEG